MEILFGLLQLVAGLVLIICSKKIANWTSSVYKRRALDYTISVIAHTKWDSPFMRGIFRAIAIIWGVVLILSAYVTVFGTIDLRASEMIATVATGTVNEISETVSVSQALPGQGSIVGGALLGSSSSMVLPSFATTTAAASTTLGTGILSEHNKLGITGSCVVKTSGNAKQCAIYVTYTTAAGDPVLGVPVTIATMNGEGMFMDVDGPLLLKNTSGKVVQYSGVLPGIAAQDVATYIGPATATSTLFVVLTPDGLRTQSTFASSTAMQ